MDSVQRVMAALDHRTPDRVPLDYWAVPEITQRLLAQFDLPDGPALCRRLRVDMVRVLPTFGGRAISKIAVMEGSDDRRGGEDWHDEWGCRQHWMPHAHGGGYWEPVTYPLASAQSLDDLRSYSWPDLELYDWDRFSRELDAHAGLAISIGATAPRQIHILLRGFEQSLIDLALMPDFTHRLIEAITEFACGMVDRMAEGAGGRAHCMFRAGDWGMQTGLLMSPKMFREFYKQPVRRYLDAGRAHGLRVFFHTDGSVVELLDDFVDLGIDILNPVQTTCAGMDPVWLKREYGDRFCFHGAVDTQWVLPRGTPEDVKRETLQRMAQLGEGGGYIVAPCHNLQADVPTENILALYETVWEHGAYPLDLERELERLGPAED